MQRIIVKLFKPKDSAAGLHKMRCGIASWKTMLTNQNYDNDMRTCQKRDGEGCYKNMSDSFDYLIDLLR